MNRCDLRIVFVLKEGEESKQRLQEEGPWVSFLVHRLSTGVKVSGLGHDAVKKREMTHHPGTVPTTGLESKLRTPTFPSAFSCHITAICTQCRTNPAEDTTIHIRGLTMHLLKVK